MDTFIYKSIITRNSPISDHDLDLLGQEGWELITIRDTDSLNSPIYYFKKKTYKPI